MDLVQELAAVPVAIVALVLMYRLAANHMNTLSTAITRLAEAIHELQIFLQGRLHGP